MGLLNNKKQQLEVTVSTNTLLKITLFLLGTIFTLRVIENMRHPLTLVFVSFFLALALNPVVTSLSSKLKSKSRVQATAMAYAIVVSVLVSFFAIIVPPLINQTTEFIREVPATLSDIESQDSALGDFVRRYELEEQIGNFASDWSRNLGSVQGPVLNTANRIFANVISIVTVLVLTFMMLVEGPRWLDSIWKHTPTDKRSKYQKVAKKMYRVVTSYVNGQVIVATIGAAFSLVALL
ncbi:AI-2E family transporter, partial [Candidatus Saccharibacteria bacterium]|nr:AI-2E family transporter [Candidatus Saccharibacteria bacterium]